MVVIVIKLRVDVHDVLEEALANALAHANYYGRRGILVVKIGTVPSDLVGAFSLIFYSSPEEAVFKALGVE